MSMGGTLFNSQKYSVNADKQENMHTFTPKSRPVKIPFGNSEIELKAY